jgi:hypothetical protein
MDKIEAYDFTQFEDSTEGWRDLTDENLIAHETMRDFLCSLLKRVAIYEQEKFYDLLAILFLTPSALSKCLPTVYAIGASGCGKSKIGKFAAQMWGVETFSPSSTFSSLRNAVDGSKFFQGDEERRIEKNTIFVFEDLDPQVLQEKPDIFRILKFGYSRATDLITIAKPDGGNIEFRTFCLKVISSVTPIFADARYGELRRRALVIPHQKLEIVPDHWIDVDLVPWHGFSAFVHGYWHNDIRCLRFIKARKELSQNARRKQEKYGIPSDVWTMLLDPLACGVTLGYESSEALELLANHYHNTNHFIKQRSVLHELLSKLVEEEQELQLERNLLRPNEKALPFSLSPKQVKSSLVLWEQEGFLIGKPSQSELSATMKDLNLRLTRQGWIKI